MKTPRTDSEHGIPRNEEDIRRLLESAGKRPEPPAEDLAAIRAAARSAWQELARDTQRRRFQPPARRVLALAASLVLAVLAGWWWMAGQVETMTGPTVASVELVSGMVRLDAEALVAGTNVREGATVSTGVSGSQSRVALRMVDGRSLRLDAGTVVTIESSRRVALVRGGVYVDSPPSLVSGGGIDVVTDLGTVVEIGTQFEVRLDEGAGVLDVRVREGAVSVRREGRSVTARLGEALTVRRDGSVSRNEIAADDAEWDWVLDAAPAFETEGQTIAALLEWVGRETGRKIAYESDEVREAAATIRLHGTVEGLRPDDPIDVLLRGSGLESTLQEDSTLLVSRL